MAATTTLDHIRPATTRLSQTRGLSVAGATLAAVAVWVLAVPLLGTHLLVRFGSGAPQNVGIDLIVGASLMASLLGWASLATLERLTSRARTIWTGAAVAVLLGSLSLPLIAGTTMATKVALALMHVIVAVVLIPALRRS